MENYPNYNLNSVAFIAIAFIIWIEKKGERQGKTFLMEGSSHSYQRALHCLADLRTRREEIRAHWFLPYFMTAAFKISSSVFFHTPPFIIILIFALLLRCFSYYCFSAFWVSNPQNPPPQINKIAAAKPSALALSLSLPFCVCLCRKGVLFIFVVLLKLKRGVCVCVSF